MKFTSYMYMYALVFFRLLSTLEENASNENDHEEGTLYMYMYKH